jgi:glycosyltransferase involved in cell wall biosynthesis
MTPVPVVAIIAAYNEADILGQVVGDFIRQGVGVYVIDHGSTDGTAAAVEPYLGRGVLGVERFGDDRRETDRDAGRFPWASILRRKEALAQELPAAWFIHTDADEFRESPWAGVTLAEAVRRVDAAGYNAIDSSRFDFWPVHDGLKPGDDVRASLRFYEPAPPRDRLQIRCWKQVGGRVDLASSGGHDVRFPGRNVFPLRFIVRHYPIRSQAHGERKVFRERRPRFLADERARGWHVQYDALREGVSFLRDPATLTEWDPDAVRLALVLGHRGVEALEAEIAQRARLAGDLERRVAELDRLRHGLEGQLDGLYRSRSWRWTAPLRAAFRVITGTPA